MAAPLVGVVYRSGNAKTGPILTTMSSSETCPAACGMYNTCYAKRGYFTGRQWTAVDAGGGRAFRNVLPWGEFIKVITELPEGTLWRHNVAGDLPGDNERINCTLLRQLVKANQGKRGFTYTHKPLTVANLAMIREANAGGFRINLSADTLAQAADYRRLYPDLPVVCVASSDYAPKSERVEGVQYTKCPATYREDTTCKSCGLCARDRNPVVVFPAHGQGAKAYDLGTKV